MGIILLGEGSERFISAIKSADRIILETKENINLDILRTCQEKLRGVSLFSASVIVTGILSKSLR